MRQFNTLSELYKYSTAKFGDRQMNMVSDGPGGYTFREFKSTCDATSSILSSYGVGAGDRVAILSGSTPRWSVVFFTSTAFGRVAVPILPDFSENEITNVLTHSEAKALFVSERLLPKVSEECRKMVHVICDINTLEPILIDGKEPVPAEGSPAETSEPGPNDLAALIYTSGTTGKAKGVMLSHRNFTHNVYESYIFHAIGTDDLMLSVLPLAHTYELSLGLLYPFSTGTCVCYISKPPTPSVLKATLAKIRPTAMLTVPLIMEKIYKGVVIPKIKKSRTLTWLNKNMNWLMCRMAGREILRYFGGRLTFFGIGGAKLDVDVEKFLYKARFPYYIGYGLTECAPLLAGISFRDTKPGCIGWAAEGVTLKLNNINPETGEGEIVAKGPNIMLGYYKDEERTAEAFTEDGWFKTNDLAKIDKKGRYGIKGRLNNMILGPSGENIYPEEIEKVIKDVDGVEETIVVQRNKKLIALIQASDDIIKDVEGFKERILAHTNANVNASSKIGEVQVMKEPFQLTATKKIRRFIYKDSAPTFEQDKENGESKQD